FICGGAFVGLEDIIRRRTGDRKLGFGASAVQAVPIRKEQGRGLLREAQPEDLLKFGLIPEFVGRFPVISALEELDVAALERILLEPKNSLVKQYKRLLEFENVQLRYTDGALRAIAKQAYERKV